MTETKAESRIINIPAAVITLAIGEAYAGIVLAADGTPSHHLILLPGDTESTWKKADDWAKSIGGELPTRQEQALLYANAKSEFEGDWYWSGEQHPSGPYYAYITDFSGGYQYWGHKYFKYRARAVRRLVIS